MINLPKNIKISAFVFDIKEMSINSANSQDIFGKFSCIEQVITISEKLNKRYLLNTFLHEVNHAVFWSYGIKDKDEEERTVDALATAWAQIYQDNPDVLRFIKECTEND